MLTDQAKKTTLLHAHTHARLSRQEGYEDAPQQHRPAPAEILLLFFRSAPTTSLETADFVAQMEKDPKKKNRFSSQPSACHTQDRHRTGRGVAELSLCCFSTRTKSCRWQQCPFHALHSTHIPSFAHGRGQTPYLPLEISLET